MRDSELADPYMTPRTAPARRPMNYLIVAVLLAIVLLTVAAASLMVWWSIRPARLMIDRGPFIYEGRGPVPRIEQPEESPEADPSL